MRLSLMAAAFPEAARYRACASRRACIRSPPLRPVLQAIRTLSLRVPSDRKSTRLNSSHLGISYAVFCLKKKYALLLLFFAATGFAQNNSYLFDWSGDDAKKGSDFLAVIDADSKSPHYGQVISSVAVPGSTGTPHNTEQEMPEGVFLLANAFESGRSMLFCLREPKNPSLVTSFGDLDLFIQPFP